MSFKDYSACGIRRMRVFKLLDIIKNKKIIDAEELSNMIQFEFGIREKMARELICLCANLKMIKIENKNITPNLENYPKILNVPEYELRK